jgi:tRNA U34 2-thiouridine synthase MnmA/TrmU
VHWSSNRSRPERIEVRVRHSPRAAAARMSAAGTDISIELDEGDQGLAPGQVAVLYDGEVCLGGGQISLPTDLPLAVKSRSTMVSDRASNRSPLR